MTHTRGNTNDPYSPNTRKVAGGRTDRPRLDSRLCRGPGGCLHWQPESLTGCGRFSNRPTFHPLAPKLTYNTFMIKFTDTQSPEAVALTATIQLHEDMLNSYAFAGYDGTKDAFDCLYRELFIIARDEVSLEVDPVDQVVETFFQYQLEISEGERNPAWFEYH